MALSASSGTSRLHWDAENGWLLDVVAALPDQALRKVAQIALTTQKQRFHSLPPGDRKDQLAGAIRALMRGEIRQRVIGKRGDGRGDIVLFNSEKKEHGEHNRLILDLGGR